MMNTNETPQPQTSISQMTPLPGESVQTLPDLFKFLVAEYEKQQLPVLPDGKPNAQLQVVLETAKLLQNFSEMYFQNNPPLQATASDNRAVITLSDNQKVQVGGDPAKDFAPGTIEPSTSIHI
jgi:hypothetical protein